MESKYKYFIPSVPKNPWSAIPEERAKKYDLVLIDIIDSGMMLADACRKNGVNIRSFENVASQQKKLGLTIPTRNGGFVATKFDPNGIYKYWVVPANHEEHQTVEFGKMMDVLIQQHIEGDSLEVVAERFGLSEKALKSIIVRLRKAGSPIPYLPARSGQTKRGGNTEANPDIFYFVDGSSRIKPHIVLQWVDKRVQGYSCNWIAGEYGVAGWTVARLTKPLMNG
jgi:hypothetical protein